MPIQTYILGHQRRIDKLYNMTTSKSIDKSSVVASLGESSYLSTQIFTALGIRSPLPLTTSIEKKKKRKSESTI